VRDSTEVGAFFRYGFHPFFNRLWNEIKATKTDQPKSHDRSKLDANNFFKRSRRQQAPVSTTKPAVKTVPPIAAASIKPTIKAPTDPFATFDPQRIAVVPSSLPEQLQREAHQLADVYNETIAL
jgi:hypothetical protein